MKQFVIIAYDAKDSEAKARRLAARQAHILAISELRAQGKVICGIALTDEQEEMIGSVIVSSFPTRADVDKWLETEPYVINKVWEEVTVLPGNLGPSFADLLIKTKKV